MKVISLATFLILQATQESGEVAWDLNAMWDGPPWYVRLYLFYLLYALLVGPVYVFQLWRSFGLGDAQLQKAATQSVHTQLNRFRDKARSLVTHLGLVPLLLLLTLSMAVGNLVRELQFSRATDRWWLYWLADVLPMVTIAALVVVILFISQRYISGRVERRARAQDALEG